MGLLAAPHSAAGQIAENGLFGGEHYKSPVFRANQASGALFFIPGGRARNFMSTRPILRSIAALRPEI